MRIVFVLLVATTFIGCAYVPIEEVQEQARVCVANHRNEEGILAPAPDEYATVCWAEWNRREESRLRSEERRAARENNCPDRRPIEFCNRGHCGCITRDELSRILRRGTRY